MGSPCPCLSIKGSGGPCLVVCLGLQRELLAKAEEESKVSKAKLAQYQEHWQEAETALVENEKLEKEHKELKRQLSRSR